MINFMKMKIKLLILSLAMATAWSSCRNSSMELRDISDSTAVVYMPQAVTSPAVYSFEISGKADSIVYGACYGGPHSPASDIPVKFSVDASLIDHFNSNNFTSYPMLPEGSYELEQSSAVIPAGRYSTAPLNLVVHVNKLEGVGSYLLPVTIETNMSVNEKLRTAYFLINGRYTTNPFPAIDRSKWKVTGFSSEEPTGEGASNGHAIHAFDGDVNTFWTTQWKAAKPGPPHYITVDMQESRKIHGISITGRTDKNTGEVKATGNPKNIIVELSADGNNWTYSESFTLANDKVSTVYLAYAQEARFVKLTVNASQGDSYLANMAEINAF